MRTYLEIVNIKTVHVVLISFAASFLAIQFHISFDFDFLLISAALIFPLVFTIREAFKRRERALQSLSRFKASLITIYYSFEINKKLDSDKKIFIKKTLQRIADTLIVCLGDKSKTKENLDKDVREVFTFIQANSEVISGGVAMRIFRLMRDTHDSIENLVAIERHRTPISLRSYCLIFIYLFPVIYTPTLLESLGSDVSFWLLGSIAAFKAFILISLFNVQERIEDPFDQDSLDDIRLDDFRFTE